LVDSLERTAIWKYDLMACLQMVVLLYKGLLKVYTNQTKVLDKRMTVVKYKDKDQASGLELAELFILLGYQEYPYKSTAILVHGDDRVKGSSGNFTEKRSNVDII
jgi:hypothetical protein